MTPKNSMKKINKACNTDRNKILKEIPTKHSNQIPLATFTNIINIDRSHWYILQITTGQSKSFLTDQDLHFKKKAYKTFQYTELHKQ